MPSFHEGRVVDAGFFASPYWLNGKYEYPPVAVLSLAVGAARVVDPAGTVAADRPVVNSAIAGVEIESVVRVCWITRVAAQCFFPRDTFAQALADEFARDKRTRGEHASAVTVDRRTAIRRL